MSDVRSSVGGARRAGWAAATCAVTATVVLAIHLLDVRDRPSVLPAAPYSTSRVDAFGDPLPVGAVARLGSRRYRVGEGSGLAVLADGERFVAGMDDGRIGVFEVDTGRLLSVDRSMQGWFRRNDAPWTLRRLIPVPGSGGDVPWERAFVHRFRLDVAGRHWALCGQRPEGESRSLALIRSTFAGLELLTCSNGGGRLRHVTLEPLSADAGTHLLFQRARKSRDPEVTLSLLRLPGPVRRDVTFGLAPAGKWTHAVRDDGRRLAVLLDGWRPSLPDVPPDAVTPRLQVFDVDSGDVLWEDWVVDAAPPGLAWGEDGALWIVGDGFLEERDADDGTVRRRGDVVRAPQRRVSAAPSLGVIAVGESVLELPASLAARWSDEAHCASDLFVLEPSPDEAPTELAARVVDDELVVVVRADSAPLQAARLGSGRPASATTAHAAAIRALSLDPDARRLAVVDESGALSLWDVASRVSLWSTGRRVRTDAFHVLRLFPTLRDQHRFGLGFTRDGKEMLAWDPGSFAVERFSRRSAETGASLSIAARFLDAADVLIAPAADHVAVLEDAPSSDGNLWNAWHVLDGRTGGATATMVLQRAVVGLNSVDEEGGSADFQVLERDATTRPSPVGAIGAMRSRLHLRGETWQPSPDDAVTGRLVPSVSLGFLDGWDVGSGLGAIRVRRDASSVWIDARVAPRSIGARPGPVIWSVAPERHARDQMRRINVGPELEVAPDGRRAVLFSRGRPALLLDLDAGKVLAVLPAGEGSATAVLWHPDGERFVTGAADGSVLIWDAGELERNGR